MAKKLIIFGTRPEFIKILPLIWETEKKNIRSNYFFLFSGQQYHLLKNTFSQYNFKPDAVISFRNHKNSLSDSFSYLLKMINDKVELLHKKNKFKVIIAQGDTSTCLCASIAAFFNNIPFAHIEAGLRTNRINLPWPEEYFRRMVTVGTQINFAPTLTARLNLLKEGVNKKRIIVTGNTIVDFIKHQKKLQKPSLPNTGKNLVLITCHRRENQSILNELITTVKKIASKNTGYSFIWIKHPSLYHSKIYDDNTIPKNLLFYNPLDSNELFSLYERVKLLISDSGGMQEECPSFNIPVLVIRKQTERIESVEKGYSLLVPEIKKLDALVSEFLSKRETKMRNPYGAGNAAKKIITYLEKHFNSSGF